MSMPAAAAPSSPSVSGDPLDGTVLVPSPADAPTVIPVLEERLEVGKRVVDTGGYRIVKRVEERDVVVDEALRLEGVDIERRPVGQLLVDGHVPTVRQEGATTIYPVLEEILVTQKRLLLKEELRITRTEGSRRDPQTVTLRSEEITIERLDDGQARSSDPLTQSGLTRTDAHDDPSGR